MQSDDFALKINLQIIIIIIIITIILDIYIFLFKEKIYLQEAIKKNKK